MKDNLTEIVCIIDKSGSMWPVSTDTIGGFNSFLAEQKKVEGDVNMTVVLFSDTITTVNDNVSIDTIADLSDKTYFPNGGTSLYDAIGITLTSVGKRLAATDEADRPSKVIVAIMTDGEENTSKEYTGAQIKEIISHQESAYNWTFMFLAANQDACLVGKNLGLQDYATLNFTQTSAGTTGAFKNMSMLASTCRGMSMSDYSMSKSSVLNTVNYTNADGTN